MAKKKTNKQKKPVAEQQSAAAAELENGDPKTHDRSEEVQDSTKSDTVEISPSESIEADSGHVHKDADLTQPLEGKTNSEGEEQVHHGPEVPDVPEVADDSQAKNEDVVHKQEPDSETGTDNDAKTELETESVEIAGASLESTLDPTRESTASPPSIPAPKKRLTLQERLALAAGKPRKKASKKVTSGTLQQLDSPTPRSSLDSSRPSIDIKETDPSATKTIITSSPIEGPNDQIRDVPLSSTEESTELVPSNVKEFTQEQLLQLIGEVETKFKTLEVNNKELKEQNNSLKNNLENSQQQIASSVGTGSKSVADHLLKEKDEKIAQLLKEGQELSHKELKHSTLIKKLRSKESEYESIIGSLEENLRSVSTENNDLKESVKTLQNSEKSFKQHQKTLEARVTSLEFLLKEQNQLRSSLELEKVQTNKEIISLQKQIDQEKDKYQSQKQENQREVLRLELKIEELRFQAENSQTVNSTLISSNSNDETYLNLVKQHNVLQNQYTSATENWQSIEASLQGKVDNLEYKIEQLNSLTKEQESKIEILSNDLRTKTNEINNLNEDKKSLNLEKSKLENKIQSLLESLKDSEDLLQDKELKFTQEQKAIEFKLNDVTKRLKEATSLQPQTISINDTYQQQSKLQQQSSSATYSRHSSTSSFRKAWDNKSDIHFGESSSTPFQSRKSSAIFTHFGNNGERLFEEGYVHDEEDEVADRDGDSLRQDNRLAGDVDDDDDDDDDEHDSDVGSNFMPNGRGGSSSQTIHKGSQSGTAIGGSSVQLLSKLSGQVRRLEMELSTTKEELLRLSEEKKLLNEEIVKLMKDNEGIDSYKSKIDELERELQKVGGKYEHTLIILGEKSERVDELSADVDDLKDLLKLQVQQMIEMQSK